MARVAIVCATDQEAKHVVARLEGAVEGKLRRWRLVTGSLAGIDTDVLVCRVGLVHASIATAALLCAAEASGRPYTGVISCGCAGSHDPHALPGDVVVSTRVVPLASQKLLADGSRRPAGVRIGMKTPDEPHYDADAALVATAAAMVGTLDIPAWPMSVDGDGANARPPRAYLGAVGSTDTFCQHVPTLRTFAALEGTACEEMEAAGVAGACEEYGVPFIAVKDVANNELRAADDAAFTWRPAPHVVEEYGLRSALVSLGLVRAHWGNGSPVAPADAASVTAAAAAGAAAAAAAAEAAAVGGVDAVGRALLAVAADADVGAGAGAGADVEVGADADADDDLSMCPSTLPSASSMSVGDGEPQSPPLIAQRGGRTPARGGGAAAAAPAAVCGTGVRGNTDAAAGLPLMALGSPALIGRSHSWCCGMVVSPGAGDACRSAEGGRSAAAGDDARSAFVSQFGVVEPARA